MSAREPAWAQTASGRALDLARPVPPGHLDIARDVAIPLGLCARYAAQLPSGVLYSVAQHCVIGGDWIMARHRDHALALAFLLHDAHEALIGDQTRPLLDALDERLAALAQDNGVDLKGISVKLLRQKITDPLDAEIHRLAGLDWPLSEPAQRLIHIVDARMLMAERRDLLAKPPRGWGARLEGMRPLDTKGAIKPLSPARAAEAWLTRFQQWGERVRAAAA